MDESLPGGVRTVTIFLDQEETKSRELGITIKATDGLDSAAARHRRVTPVWQVGSSSTRSRPTAPRTW